MFSEKIFALVDHTYRVRKINRAVTTRRRKSRRPFRANRITILYVTTPIIHREGHLSKSST